MKKSVLIVASLFIMQAVSAQLTGVKSIPGDYATIEAAIAALNSQGVGTGGVTFNVAAGHAETFTTATAGLITASGTSGNQVLFQKSGAGSNPLITAANPGAGTMDYVVCFSGADYITFDGIDIQENVLNNTSDAQMEWAYAILKVSETNGSQHNTIKNCAITLTNANTSSRAIYSNNHTTASTTQLVVTDLAGTNSYNKYYNLTVSNCYHAFYLYGRADAAPYTFYDQNNELGADGPNTVNGLGAPGGTTASYGLYCYYQNNVQIANTTFTGVSDMASGSQYVFYLSTSSNANVDVYNNTVSMTYNGTGSFYAMYGSGLGSSGTTNTVNIYNNNIINNNAPNHTSGTIYMMYISAGGVTTNSYNNTISNNTIGSGSATSTGSFYMYYFTSSPSSAGVINVYNNTVTNNTRIQSSPGSGTNYIFYATGSAGGTDGVMNVYDNMVDNIVCSSTGTTYGLYIPATAGTKYIHDNSITNVYDANNTVYSMYNASGTTIYYYNNKIQNINMNSASGTLYGMYVSSGTNVYFYNNYISELYAPQATGATAIHGIYFSGGTSHGCYNNTIYLDASSSGSAFGSTGIYASTTPILELRNNIIVNKSVPGATGLTVAYRRSSTTLSTYLGTSNDNDFYTGTPGPSRLIYYDGTNAAETLADYQALVSPADATSVSSDPPFVNKGSHPYILHLRTDVPTQMESGGGVISTPISITDDWDGDARYPNTGYPDNPSYPATAPDIGADEFAGIPRDLTPPNIVFDPLQSTSSTTARTLLTTITDASGVPTAGAGLPVLYWKINSGSYSPVTATWLGTDQYSFTFGSGVVLGDVISYYVVAQDEVTPTPNIGAMPAGGASGFTANPPACSTPPDPPLSYSILGSICGTFQVGSGQDYVTLTDAIADLNVNEVTCPVVFELTDATYAAETLPITLGPVAGMSAMNTVTIKPAAGVTPTITGSSASAIIQFNGGRYFILDGSNTPGGTDRSLTIENTSTTTSTAVIWFSSQGVDMGSKNITIKNCNVMGGSNTVTSMIGIYLAGTTISTSGTGADNDYITIENNKVSRAYYGIFAQGVPTVGELDNLVINNNTIGGDVATDYITGYGMRFQSINGAQITNNEIYNMIYDGSKYGMYMGTTIANSLFDHNYIHAMGQTNTTASYYCIAMYFASTTNSTNNQVSNNLIHDLYMYGSTSNFYGPIGFRVVGGSNYKFWHNTVSLDGAFGSSTAGVYSNCMFISTATSNMDMRNNIFSNQMTGTDPNNYAIYTVNTTTFSPINFNDYYSNGTALGYYGAEIADFAGWQAATGQDGASQNLNPMFVSSSDLHPTNAGLDNKGIYISQVPEDYDGVLRTNPPDMGVYEFGIHADVVTLPASNVTATSATLNGSVNANNQIVSTFFDWGETINYGNTVSGVPSQITGTTTTPYNADIAGLTTYTVYHYRARGITSTGLIIYGEDMTFMPAPPPSAITDPATGITQTAATLNGTVNANSSAVTVYFEFGLTDSYGSVIDAIPAQVSGNTDTPVTANISGLEVYTTYHFRVVATNSNGYFYGGDLTFTTLPAPPVVVTNPATDVLITTAVLNGTITANNQTTAVSFEWGETTSYGNVVAADPANVTGSVPTAVSAQISGLFNNTVYHFRCVGTNATGTTYGDDQWFNTYCPPPADAGPITGPASICKPSAGNVYTVDPIADATDYIWSVPAGATITAGNNTNSITVSFDASAVSGDISVYGSSNCGVGAPSLAVAVNAPPVPTVSGPDVACVTSSYGYTTENGMNGYTWTVSAGGQITAGAGTSAITVKWNNTGAQFVTVTYTSAEGCPADAPASMAVEVSGLTSPTIAGSNTMCPNSGLHVYTTQDGYFDYVWTVSSGGTIASGQGTYQIEVNWTVSGNQTVTVDYANASGCFAGTPASFAVNVLPLPAAAGAISGTSALCEDQTGEYSVAAIANANSYEWTLPAGAVIVEGEGTNMIKVEFAPGGAVVDISVHGVNFCGNGPEAPDFEVTVNPIPPTPTATIDGTYLLSSDAPEGNQWYFIGDAIVGATEQTYQAEEEGFYWTVVTLEGCKSDESNHVEVIFVGLDEIPGTNLQIFPNPNQGQFTLTFSGISERT